VAEAPGLAAAPVLAEAPWLAPHPLAPAKQARMTEAAAAPAGRVMGERIT
jgi:hypothetical protein